VVVGPASTGPRRTSIDKSFDLSSAFLFQTSDGQMRHRRAGKRSGLAVAYLMTDVA
jgi:hypothetical protein